MLVSGVTPFWFLPRRRRRKFGQDSENGGGHNSFKIQCSFVLATHSMLVESGGVAPFTVSHVNNSRRGLKDEIGFAHGSCLSIASKGDANKGADDSVEEVHRNMTDVRSDDEGHEQVVVTPRNDIRSATYLINFILTHLQFKSMLCMTDKFVAWCKCTGFLNSSVGLET